MIPLCPLATGTIPKQIYDTVWLSAYVLLFYQTSLHPPWRRGVTLRAPVDPMNDAGGPGGGQHTPLRQVSVGMLIHTTFLNHESMREWRSNVLLYMGGADIALLQYNTWHPAPFFSNLPNAKIHSFCG
ncbi:MAG: hypothetical protein H0V70_04115 [Ktedonobacteraceae bacterium]|nr:hypothetical protein [Ktedonobacteraceae bacterium]